MANRASYESIFRKSQDYDGALAAVQRVRHVDEVARDGTTLLGQAAYYGHVDGCAWILDRGGAVDIRDSHGQTPLLTGVWALSGGVAIRGTGEKRAPSAGTVSPVHAHTAIARYWTMEPSVRIRVQGPA